MVRLSLFIEYHGLLKSDILALLMPIVNGGRTIPLF
jgi:hypothetical protein